MPPPRQRRPRPSGPAPLLRLAFGLALLAASPALAPRAEADEGERAWTAGAGDYRLREPTPDAAGETRTRDLVLASAGHRYGWTDTLVLAGDLRLGAALGEGDPEPAGLAEVEVHYILDALTWVPYLLAGTGVLATGSGPDVRWTVHAGAGIDFRPRRTWALGLALRYHAAVTDSASSMPVDLAIVLSLYPDS